MASVPAGVTVAPLLGRGVQNLPSVVGGAQVSPRKPAFIPDMEVPVDRTRLLSLPEATGRWRTPWVDTAALPTHQVSLLCANYCGKPW